MFNSQTNSPLDVAIIGVHKSGTTSLFTWLAAHPDIQGSEPKETYYFVDFDGFPAEAPTFDDDGWAGFERFFPAARNGRLRLEATPSNLFHDMALDALTNLQPPPLVIVALRCPAERTRSGFFFAQNNGAAGHFIDPALTFPAYVQALLEANPEPLARAVANDRLRWYLTESLERSKYAQPLDRWAAKLPSERFMVIGFEELTQRPRETLERICKRAGIDASFYADYEFERINPTVTQQGAAMGRIAQFVRRTVPEGRMHDVLANTYRSVRPRQFLPPVETGDEAAAMTALGEYFAPSNQALAERYGVDISAWWPRPSS